MIFGERLYHGSYMKVEKPELGKCKEGKDFGRGFYLTTDKQQAEKFLKTSIRKAEKNNIIVDRTKGYVSVFEIQETNLLRCYEFETANAEWLHCIAAHRKRGVLADEVDKWAKYDIIVGKIANDTTNQVITAYINGLYGKVGSEIADEIAIRLLMPEKLKDQICIRSQKAIEKMCFIEFEEFSI